MTSLFSIDIVISCKEIKINLFNEATKSIEQKTANSMSFSLSAVNKIYNRRNNRNIKIVPILHSKNFSLTFQNGEEKGSTVWLTVSCSRCLCIYLLWILIFHRYAYFLLFFSAKIAIFLSLILCNFLVWMLQCTESTVMRIWLLETESPK